VQHGRHEALKVEPRVLGEVEARARRPGGSLLGEVEARARRLGAAQCSQNWRFAKALAYFFGGDAWTEQAACFQHQRSICTYMYLFQLLQ
jgi:hypothetical protein